MPSTLGTVASAYRAVPLPSPFPLVQWHAAYWASDPAWTPPANGAVATTWRDGSGNGRGMTSAGGPIYRATSAINGRPAIEFDGVDDLMHSGGTFGAPVGAPLTMVGVVKAGKVANHYFASGPTASTWDLNVGIYDGTWSCRDNGQVMGPTADTASHLTIYQWAPPYDAWIEVDGVRSTNLQATTSETTPGPWRLCDGQFGAKGQFTLAFVGFMVGSITTQEAADLRAWYQQVYLPPSTPLPVTAGLAGWWDADDPATITYSTGSLISQWRDKSGAARHFNQANTAAQPARSATMNGRPAIAFDGITDELLGPTFTGVVQPVTIVTAFNRRDTGDGRYLWSTSYKATITPLYAGQRGLYAGGSGFKSPGPPIGVGPHTWTTQFNGAASTDWLDGAAGLTVDPGTAGLDAVTSMCSGGGSAFLAADVAEIIIYDRVLSTVERQQIESYLKTKWGTP